MVVEDHIDEQELAPERAPPHEGDPRNLSRQAAAEPANQAGRRGHECVAYLPATEALKVGLERSECCGSWPKVTDLPCQGLLSCCAAQS